VGRTRRRGPVKTETKGERNRLTGNGGERKGGYNDAKKWSRFAEKHLKNSQPQQLRGKEREETKKPSQSKEETEKGSKKREGGSAAIADLKTGRDLSRSADGKKRRSSTSRASCSPYDELRGKRRDSRKNLQLAHVEGSLGERGRERPCAPGETPSFNARGDR